MCFIKIIAAILLITSSYADVDDCVATWYVAWIHTAHPADPLIDVETCLTDIPNCAKDVTTATATACVFPVSVRSIKPVFICINDDNNGAQVQQAHATAILWSGWEGREKAEREHQEHRASNTFGFNGQVGKYPDTQVAVLQSLFNGMPICTNPAHCNMITNLGCMWLIWNSSPKSHGNDFHQYASIKGYERVRDQNGNLIDPAEWNRGKFTLLAGGVENALVINNYFWNLEMTAVARLFADTNYGGSRHTRRGAKMKLHQRTYTLNVAGGTAAGNEWIDYNLFGAIADLQHIPVIFERERVVYPIYCGDIAATVALCNLGDLLTAYNNQAVVLDRITAKLHMDIRKLILFGTWTRAIPFHAFPGTPGNHKYGGWVSTPPAAAQPIPGGKGLLAHLAPQNLIGDAAHTIETDYIFYEEAVARLNEAKYDVGLAQKLIKSDIMEANNELNHAHEPNKRKQNHLHKSRLIKRKQKINF